MTAQIADRITFDGETWAIRAEPLRPWLKQNVNIDQAFRKTRSSIQNRRGYRAIWIIDGDNLLLTQIESAALDTKNLPPTGLRAFAGWITGEMMLLSDGCRERHHEMISIINGEKTDNAAIITIISGKLTASKRISVSLAPSAGGLIIDHSRHTVRGIKGDDTHWGAEISSPAPVDSVWATIQPRSFSCADIKSNTLSMPREALIVLD